MESADARVALLSFYLSRNAGIKSVPPSPRRRGDGSKGKSSLPQRSTLKRPMIDLFGAGGQTIYGVSEGCPTLAALGRIEAVEEQRRMRLLEALVDRLYAGAKERQGEVMEGEEMFAKYIDIDKCI